MAPDHTSILWTEVWAGQLDTLHNEAISLHCVLSSTVYSLHSLPSPAHPAQQLMSRSEIYVLHRGFLFSFLYVPEILNTRNHGFENMMLKFDSSKLSAFPNLFPPVGPLFPASPKCPGPRLSSLYPILLSVPALPGVMVMQERRPRACIALAGSGESGAQCRPDLRSYPATPVCQPGCCASFSECYLKQERLLC